jgi:membrane protein
MITFLVWLWITNVAIVLGAEFNAERERSKELDEGNLEAARELQIDLRSEPETTKRARTT